MSKSEGIRTTPTGRTEINKLLTRKQEERQEDFARLRSLYKFGPEEDRIVTLGWEALVRNLQTRQLSATRVLEAFIGKTLEICESCNPVTDFIPQAHAWAKELDSLKEVKGPLHGIPFCVKDDTNVIGMDTTHGFGKRLFNPAPESAVIVKVLHELGAVAFCKTNVPQGLCSLGGTNPVFGTTTNAHNPNLTPGGSSSGTGSLVGSGGALFGTGSDLGGSLRIPAHFNGVSSLKPTAHRISNQGFVPPTQPSIVGLDPVVGIIGQTPSIVTAVFQAMIESGRHPEHDVSVPPIPWNHASFRSPKSLRIGYSTSMPFFPTMGDSGEMVLRAKAALESLGHTLVEFKMPDPYDYMGIFGRIVLADQRGFKRIWKGEKIIRDSKAVASSTRVPLWIQRLVGRLMRTRLIPGMHSKRLALFMGAASTKSTHVWDAVAEKRRVTQELLSEWEQLELDGLIHNTLPFPAPRSDVVHKLNACMAYTLIWNLVEFPVGVVTMGAESGNKLGEFDDEGDLGFRAAKKVMGESVGAPIGIQVVGKPFREETVLRIMTELEPFNTFKTGEEAAGPESEAAS